MSNEHPYYNQTGHGPFETHDIGDLVLEEGGTLRKCMVAYSTFGTLNAARDNAILVTTWYRGGPGNLNTAISGNSATPTRA